MASLLKKYLRRVAILISVLVPFGRQAYGLAPPPVPHSPGLLPGSGV